MTWLSQISGQRIMLVAPHGQGLHKIETSKTIQFLILFRNPQHRVVECGYKLSSR